MVTLAATTLVLIDPCKSLTLLVDPGAYDLKNVMKKLFYNHPGATFSIFTPGGALVDHVKNTMLFPINIVVTSQKNKPALSIVVAPL